MNPILYRKIFMVNTSGVIPPFPPPPPYVIAVRNGSAFNMVTNLSYILNYGPSIESDTFKIIAIGLFPVAGNVLVIIPIGFEVYDGSTWRTTSFNIPYTSGQLNTAQIYKIRMATGLSVNIYSGSITLHAGNAPNYEIVASGEVADIPGIVSFYKLNGNSNDATGTNNGTDTDITYITGKIGQAASFNGTTSFISLPQDVFSFTNKISISLWVNFNNVIDEQMIFANYSVPPLPNGNGYYLELYQSKIQFSTAINNSSTLDVKSGIILTNRWYNIVCTFDSTIGSKLYINGVLVDFNVNTNPIFYDIYTHYPTIGSNKISLLNNRLFLNGLEDSVLISNQVFDSVNVTFLYNEGYGI